MSGCKKIYKVLILVLLNFYLSSLFANTHNPQDFLQKIKGTSKEGQAIVEHYCASCHAPKPLIEIGAPKINDKKDWDVRLKRGIKTLLLHTDSGFNMMPPRGGCFECNDLQLELAVSAMLDEENRKIFEKALKDLKKNTE